MAGEARVQLLVAMYYELICITRKDRLTAANTRRVLPNQGYEVKPITCSKCGCHPSSSDLIRVNESV